MQFRRSPNTEKQIGLEYIRGVAALTVAISHYILRLYPVPSWEYLAGIAVEIFFPLSGFVLGRQILQIVAVRSGLGIFFSRRWIRTLPAYILALVLISHFFGKVLDESFFEYFFFIKYLSPDFAHNNFFPVAWSLAVEEWYYILFPLFIFATTTKKSTESRLLLLSVGFCLLFVALRLIASRTGDVSFLRIGTLFRLDAICIGFVFFLLSRYSKAWFILFGAATGSVAVGVLVIFLPHLLPHVSTIRPLQAAIVLTLIPIFFGSLVALISLWEDRHRHYFWPFVRGLGLWLGRVSYSVFLFHLLIIYFAFPNAVLSDLPYYLLTLGVICTITFYLFEKPLLDLRPQYPTRTPLEPRKTW